MVRAPASFPAPEGPTPKEATVKKLALAAVISGIWINLSEFLRNELLFKHYWVRWFEDLGQVFPSSPLNNALWVIWGFLLAAAVAFLARRLTFGETFLLAWTLGFVLMWIVIGNLNVLPHGLLLVAVPWSVVEIAGAVWISRAIMSGGRSRDGVSG